MDALWLGLVGVLGTLGGSAVTHHFDLRRWNREVQVENARRLADLRRQTMAEFADAIFGYRRVQLQNWYQMSETCLDEDHTAVAPEMRSVRERAWAAFGRLALSWEDSEVLLSAENVLERVGRMTKFVEGSAVKGEAEGVRIDLKALLSEAKTRLVLGDQP